MSSLMGQRTPRRRRVSRSGFALTKVPELGSITLLNGGRGFRIEQSGSAIVVDFCAMDGFVGGFVGLVYADDPAAAFPTKRPASCAVRYPVGGRFASELAVLGELSAPC